MLESTPRRSSGFCAAIVLSIVACLMQVGCWGGSKKAPRAAAPTGPVFQGEGYLRGSVGSMGTIRNFRSSLVSGWGLVILPAGSGTGSSDVPAFLRQWMLNEMRKRGVGSYAFGGQDLSPRQMLASKDTAVVRVQGLIPPGAIKGTTFPLMVSAVDGTQTTSLEGGRLWTTDLSPGGDNTSLAFTKKRASGGGAIFINPFDDKLKGKERLRFQREGIVLAGGVVTKDHSIDLVLNQPSYARARLIADRINERYPHERSQEFYNTAIAKSDLLIQLNVPKRFSSQPAKLLRLVEHTFVRKSPGFESNVATMLGDVLVNRKDQAGRVVEAWQGLGKIALSTIEEFYEHKEDYVRFAALEAGSWLQDELAANHLAKLTLAGKPQTRTTATRLLRHMSRSGRASRAVRGLIDDADRGVRIAAYKALVEMGDESVHRTLVGDSVKFKFFLDIVKAKNPMVYISQTDIPTLVIFGPNTGFRKDINASLWEGRLRIRAGSEGKPMKVFYQPTNKTEGKVYEIAPFVGNLAFVLGHRASARRPIDGFDLSFSSVVNAVYNLQKQDVLIADIDIEMSPLAAAIVQSEKRKNATVRPDDSDGDIGDLGDGDAPDIDSGPNSGAGANNGAGGVPRTVNTDLPPGLVLPDGALGTDPVGTKPGPIDIRPE